jgi:hypothetical protein
VISTGASSANPAARRAGGTRAWKPWACSSSARSFSAFSLQLPFALVPLVQFTGDKSKMGQFANSWWVAALAWLTAAAIILLNALLILLIFRGNA